MSLFLGNKAMTYISIEMLLIAVLYFGTVSAFVVISLKFREQGTKLKQSVRVIEKLREETTRARFASYHIKDDVQMLKTTDDDLQAQINLLVKNPEQQKVN